MIKIVKDGWPPSSLQNGARGLCCADKIRELHLQTWLLLGNIWCEGCGNIHSCGHMVRVTRHMGRGAIASVALAHMVGTIYATHVVGDKVRCDSMCFCTHGWCYTIVHGVGCGAKWDNIRCTCRRSRCYATHRVGDGVGV